MRRKRTLYFLALSFALGATSNILADGPTFTQIDFLGAASTQAWGITANGDIAGGYVSADNSTHGFLRTRGELISIDFPGAAYTYVNGISPPRRHRRQVCSHIERKRPQSWLCAE